MQICRIDKFSRTDYQVSLGLLIYLFKLSFPTFIGVKRSTYNKIHVIKVNTTKYKTLSTSMTHYNVIH